MKRGDFPEYVHLVLDGKVHEMAVEGKGLSLKASTFRLH